MDYDLDLVIHYAFDRPTGGGRQLLRVTPARLPGQQQLLDAALSIAPAPLESRRFTDFFGTEVNEVVLPAGLTEMTIALKARVARSWQEPGLDVSAGIGTLEALLQGVTDLRPDSPWHFRAPSPRIPPVAEIADFARQAVGDAATAQTAVEALGLALHERMEFVAGVTDVDTPVAEAFAGRRGVCQDFAQIMICGLRSLGIPAGYVGGFLRTLPPPGQPRLKGADAMHAWSRAWAGPQAGWIEYDATNRCWANGDHISVGHGRDYGDVAPVTGSLRLDGAQSSSHAVDIAERPLP